MDDLFKYNLFFNRTSKTVQKARRRVMIAGPVCMFLISFGIIISSIQDSMWPAFIGSLIGAGVLALFYAWYFKYLYPARLRKLLKKLYAEDKNPGAIGERSLEVDENGFTLTTPFSQTRCAWGQLVRIESEPGYTYLFTSSVNAVPIPHASIEAGNLRAILAEVEKHYHPEKLLAQ
jgi:hypothetical protein